MKYEGIVPATFLERPNRFIAQVELGGLRETVHVKNTGRCRELLRPGAGIYLQESRNPARKTRYDLIAVKKGERLVNMDSQVPNLLVQEWIREGRFLEGVTEIRPETTYGASRFDLYLEAGDRKIFIEVKGVTLEQEGVVRFPDAPSDRAVKHVQELARAVKEGYEAYVFFVVQMEGVRYFTPNRDTHPAFWEALIEAARAGVRVVAYDCRVTPEEIHLQSPVPVILREPLLAELEKPLLAWYRKNRRDLPWRQDPTPYHVWVSEIMLQQTRVETVKPYYERFLKAFPDPEALAEAPQEELLKLWEGLGYYSRARNLQQAARQIREEFGGVFPKEPKDIRRLKGVGSYTAGAIAAFAFGLPKAAVDGNVLRVLSRFLASREDIASPALKTYFEEALEEVIPRQAAGDFGQGLIELGALVCLPGAEPKCEDCPLRESCRGHSLGVEKDLPYKRKAKARRVEKRTVFLFEDDRQVALARRPEKGLLAGLYEFPNVEGHLSKKEAVSYSKSIGLSPIRIQKLPAARHVFSHVEWEMIGYRVQVDALEKHCRLPLLFANRQEVEKKYPIPSAFSAYREAFWG